MGRYLAIAIIGLVVAGIAGCQQPAPQPKQSISKNAVLDVKATPRTPTFATPPQRVAPPEENGPALVTAPVTTTTPNAGAAPSPKASKASVKASHNNGGSYVVKKGDTLYHIAKAEYGDGKKWTVIASANPGISPQALKAGQTLVIP